MEKYGDRDAGEFIAASWAALDDLHTLFRDVLLEAWTLHALESRRLPRRQSFDDRVPRTWCDVYSLRVGALEV